MSTYRYEDQPPRRSSSTPGRGARRRSEQPTQQLPAWGPTRDSPAPRSSLLGSDSLRSSLVAGVSIALTAALVLGLGVLVARALARPVDDPTTTSFEPTAALVALTPTVVPTPPSATEPAVTVAAPGVAPSEEPTPAPSPEAISRLAIASIGVDAPIVTKGLDANKVMEAPDKPFDVAWYGFSARPGQPGNAVFSGHVDFARVGPAVFWRLRDVKQGDEVSVRMEDGTVFRYRVVSKVLYREATAPVDEIIGPTRTETVTIITCGGTFNRATGRYDDRLVVRAERVP